MSKLQIFFSIVIFVVIIITIVLLSRKPSLERDWEKDQEVLPTIIFSGDEIEIKNMRDFKYSWETEYEINYYDKQINITELKSLDYIIEPFSDFDGPAHTMFSFGLNNWEYIIISAEIRKEKGESFSPFKWITREYEIVYMIWSETDFVKLRANYRKDDVIVYPIKTSQEKTQELFISMLKRADSLSKNPEFYNTITQNCTTSILDHVNELREEKIPWTKEALLPSHSDKVIYDLGLIDTKLSLEEARKYYQINELSEQFADDENYSEKIRKQRK
jgi:hypothetical protein